MTYKLENVSEHIDVNFHLNALAEAMLKYKDSKLTTCTGKYGKATLNLYIATEEEQFHPERTAQQLVFSFHIERPDTWTVNGKAYIGVVEIMYYLSGPKMPGGVWWSEKNYGSRWSSHVIHLALANTVNDKGTDKGRKAVVEQCQAFAHLFDLKDAISQAKRRTLLDDLKRTEDKLRVKLVELDDLKAKQAEIIEGLLVEGIDITGQAEQANAEADRAEADTRGQLSADTPVPQPLVAKPKPSVNDEIEAAISRHKSAGTALEYEPQQYWLAAAVPAREQFGIPSGLVPMAFSITLKLGAALLAPSAYDKRAINEVWYPDAETALKAAEEYVVSREA